MSNEIKIEVINLGDVTKICRLCLENGNVLQPLQESSLLENFRKISQLPLKLDTKLPKKICEPCLTRLAQLQELSQFLTCCKRSQQILKAFFDHAYSGGKCTVRMEVTEKEGSQFEVRSGVIEGIIPLQEQPGNPHQFQEEEPEFPSDSEETEEKCVDHIEENPLDPSLETAIKTEVVEEENIDQEFEYMYQEIMKIDQQNENVDQQTGNMDQKDDEEAEIDSQRDFFFQCPECNFASDIQSEVINHSVDTHGVYKTKCLKCSQFVVNLREHVKQFPQCKLDRVKRQMCDRCGDITCDTLATHLRTKCTNTKCTQCEYSAKTAQDLRQHFTEMHDTTRSLCRECWKYFPDLNEHRRQSEKCRFKCDQCDYTALQKSRLLQHQNKHSEMRPFTCDRCGIGFRYETNLTRHKRLHDFGPEYKCTFCPRKFTTKPHMQGHMNLEHFEQKPYKCHYCDQTFAYIMSRSSHAKKEHKSEYVPQSRNKRLQHYKTTDLTKPYSAARSFECDLCNESYKTKVALKAHQSTHKTNSGRDMRIHLDKCKKT